MSRYVPPHLRAKTINKANPERQVERTKVLVVPYIQDFLTQEKRIIFFLDTDSKEWSLVSGGCGKRDKSILACADRELQEESNKALSFSPRVISTSTSTNFTFETQYRVASHKLQDEKENIKVKTTYHVFLIEVVLPFEAIVQKYYGPLSNGETSGMTSFSFDFLKRSSNQTLKSMGIWDFIIDECLPYLRKYL